jgi:hypothetical protein
VSGQHDVIEQRVLKSWPDLVPVSWAEKVIPLYRRKVPPGQIALVTELPDWAVDLIIKVWSWRVLVMAYHCGLWEWESLTKPLPGRPIDMGGPRDTWIDRDPWSEL